MLAINCPICYSEIPLKKGHAADQQVQCAACGEFTSVALATQRPKVNATDSSTSLPASSQEATITIDHAIP